MRSREDRSSLDGGRDRHGTADTSERSKHEQRVLVVHEADDQAEDAHGRETELEDECGVEDVGQSTGEE